MEIRNYNEVLETLIALLKEFDKNLNTYQIDVYLYYNEETQEVKVDTFVNVGGNSWINDNHYTAYSDREHYNSFLEYFESVDDIAFILDTTKEELAKATAECYEYELEYVDDCDIRRFVEENPEYHDILFDYYASEIETCYNYYYTEQAETMLDAFCEFCEEISG